jgi:hypothetical protein
MLFVIVVALLVTVLLAVIVCATTKRACPNALRKRYCERRYINWAWGFQHTGFYIDDEGHVYEFDASVPRRNSIDEDKPTYNTLEKDHWGKNRVLVETLSPAELSQYHTLLDAAVAENAGLGKQTGYGNDGGSTMFDCYKTKGDADAPMTKYELRVDGDVPHQSGGPHGRELAEWLDKLGHALLAKKTNDDIN